MIRSDYRGRRRAEKRLRGGLYLLAVSAVVPGLWALLFPRSFFDDFPGAGSAWVSMLPPYNQHLVTDVGAFYCALALLMFLAGRRADRRITVPALWVWLVFSVPHLIFHLTHLDGFSARDAIGETLSLLLLVVLPLWLLPTATRTEHF